MCLIFLNLPFIQDILKEMKQFLLFVTVGFFAQMIDGTLGMAYGVSSRTFLKTVAGLPSNMASAVVHAAEVPTTLVSGISHWRIGNVDYSKIYKLAIPGVIGGVIGSYFIMHVGAWIEPIISCYLIAMGFMIIFRASMKKPSKTELGNKIMPLGFLGGFLDATGGGGWGPVVTSTMVASGHNVKKAIGTVNVAEFMVTIATTVSFIFMIGNLKEYFLMILGMIVGGVVAAPIAARLCHKLPTRPLMFAVGILLIVLNTFQLFQ